VSEVNWNDAPEWADVWIEDLDTESVGDRGGWHRETVMKYIDKDGKYWLTIGTEREIKVHYPPAEAK
jgi:hypothetical protein